MNGTYSTSIVAQQPGSKLIDDLLRRELRVGDPRNALEVATALRQRYSTAAARIDQEAAGLPLRLNGQAATYLAPITAGETPGSREERRVQADLESDLTALIESRDNREWAPEIRGWRDVLLREFAEGTAAARFAHDPAMRDRGFLTVRRFCEFARVARLIGVMNLPLNLDYRRLASTLDAAANVVRIQMGEALHDAGLGDGGFITQVPLIDLRQRRESLVLAVRRLTGTAEITDEGGDWGDGVAAYRRLLDELDRRSAPELSVYLREEMLVVVLDGLVGSVARQDPEALRQVAATAPVEIARLNQLIVIAASLTIQLPFPAPPNPVAAALTFFVQSLQLFLDAFRAPRANARLIDLAIPLAMAAGQADEADRDSRSILREIVSRRGDYAAEIECFLSCCGSDIEQLELQVRLDKVLFDIHKAVDLFAQGDSSGPDWGDDSNRPGVFSPERRASAYSVIIRNMVEELRPLGRQTLIDVLSDIADALDQAFPQSQVDAQALLDDVFQEQLRAELDWEDLIRALAPRCLDGGRSQLVTAGRALLHGSEPDYRKKNPPPIVVASPPPPLRVGIERLTERLARPEPGPEYAGDTVISDCVDYAAEIGATKELQTLVSRWMEQKRRSTVESGGARAVDDAQLVTFVEELSDSCHSVGEYRRALGRKATRERWASLKARAVRTGQALPADLENLVDDLLDPSKGDQIDMAQVRKVFQQVLSRKTSD